MADRYIRCVGRCPQAGFTYFKIIGWGCMDLSTLIDDVSRDITARRAA